MQSERSEEEIEMLRQEARRIQIAEIEFNDDDPVVKALCALKEAADFIGEETDSPLGAARLHRLADDGADQLGLEITETK